MSPAFRQSLLEDPVVITGVGAVSVCGNSAAELWDAAVAGRPGGRAVRLTGAGVEMTRPGCPVPLTGAAMEAAGPARKLDYSVRMAMAAAAEAAAQAGWENREISPARRGVAAGTSRGCRQQWEESRARVASGLRPRPTMAAVTTLASLSGALAQRFGAAGPGLTLSAACASGAAALAYAAEQLLLGNADMMLAGGADAVMDTVLFQGMEAAGLLAEHADPARACRPFDTARNGLLLGEGAGFLALERASHARHRGAEILGRLAGWAVTVNEGAGKTGIQADGRGLADAMERALAVAGLTPAAIDSLNAHGTSTRLNDAAEAAALFRVFGPHPPPVSATKAVTGHCLGATPALEAILSLASLRHGLLPPTVCCDTPDPAFAGLDIVRGAARASGPTAVLSNSLGFWGCHASLVFLPDFS